MKAFVCPKYGSPDVLELKELPRPEPKEDEVLIKVKVASVNAGDCHLLRGTPWLVRLMYGLQKPKHPIPGSDVAGIVEAVGSQVEQFKPGDEVFGDLSICGFGAFAEWVCAPEKALAHKPANLSFEEAAALPVAAGTALQGLRDKGRIGAGKKVLINGASGGVGTYAVQLAKAFGAEVTAVCSTQKVDMVRSLGADKVIDYRQEDFTRNGQHYDLILAANGYHSLTAYKRVLSPDGVYVMSGGAIKPMFEAMLLGPLHSRKGGKQMGNLLVQPNQKDLLLIKEFSEAGKIKPLIDRRYSLKEVPEAIRYLEEGHARGKVVISD